MPFINVKWAGELTLEQREKMAQGITDAVHDATGKPKNTILVCIDQSPRDHWAKEGTLLQ